MSLPTERGCVLGVEIGGSKLQAAVGTREGEILDSRTARAEPNRGARGIRSQIEALIRPLLESANRRPEAIGVGFGGPVETATGTVLVSHQVEGWKDFALRPWFEERFGLPCLVENDSNCAGLAEHRRGAGRGTRNMVYMNIGSGIGGAIILNGELYNGQGRGAGEIGHTWIPNLWGQPTQRPDHEGGPEAPDKLELLCSGWAIEQRLREVAAIPAGTPLHALTGGLPDRITGPIVAQAAARGDRLVLEKLDRITDMLGLAVANVITLFHPERYVIGGGFAQLGAPLFDRLRASVDRYVFGPFKGRYEILPAQLEQTVVIVGALLIAPRS